MFIGYLSYKKEWITDHTEFTDYQDWYVNIFNPASDHFRGRLDLSENGNWTYGDHRSASCSYLICNIDLH